MKVCVVWATDLLSEAEQLGDMLTEVNRFHDWAQAYPSDRRFGEWECDYDHWPDLRQAVQEFVAHRSFDTWSPEQVRAVLYAIARENETQRIASEIRRHHPRTLLRLAAASLTEGEADARWQLADELGHLEPLKIEAEHLLLLFARDENEYVRRRTLGSLTQLGSEEVERLASEMWLRDDANQQWARMKVLACLSRIGSSRLETYLLDAARDDRPYLREYANRVRRGEVE
jgi:HEAT repeat protein